MCALTIAFLIATIINNKNAINGIVNVIALGSSFLCGAFVPVEWLPKSVLTIAHMIPTYWYIQTNELMKTIEEFNIETLMPVFINMGVIILFSISFIILTNIFSKKKIVFLQHGVTKDDISKIYSRKQQKIDLFITCANKEYESIVNTESYFLEKNQVALTGFPRFDKLKSTSDKIILIMPTWRDKAVSFSSDITQVKVSPAFSNSYYYNYYHTLLNDERLHNIAKKFGYKLVYFPHNNMVPTNEYFSDIQNVYIVEGKDRVYSKYLSSAALLITDYSSTAFDFASPPRQGR